MSSLFPVIRSNRGYSMMDDVDSIFNSFFVPLSRGESKLRNSSFPKTNVVKKESGYSIELAYPGLSRDEFEVQVENNTLSVSHNSEDTQQYIESCVSQEYSFSSFSRAWTLPESAITDGIEARYEAGILRIEIPVESQQSRKKNIEVF